MKTVRRKVERIQLSKALGNLDDNYDLLSGLYEKLQLSAAEASDLNVDFLTFANKVSHFAIITKTVHSKVVNANESTGTEYEQSSSVMSRSTIGFVYIDSPKNKINSNSQVNMGVIVDGPYRGKGYGRRAIKLTLNRAFKLFRCHRVQATIHNPLSPTMHTAYKAFIAAGFKQEGIQRRAHYNHFDSEWQDVVHLAMLDTEWCFHQPAGKKDATTVWDEMISRHQRESEELAWAGESSKSVRRQHTTEQIKGMLLDWDNDDSEPSAD